jgi:hypothetical protein
MKISSYKNLVTGETVSFETGSRRDRKVRADSKKYQLIVNDAAPIAVKIDPEKVKKPEKSG